MKSFFLALFITLWIAVLTAREASAHQPFFEAADLTFGAPYVVQNPEISLAYYATLETANDVDYYAFDGKAGERILLQVTIPQIAGHEDFAPTLALLGPGLPETALPSTVERLSNDGALVFHPPTIARTFYEPFSGTSYWERQKEFATLPVDGKYMVAVWHPHGAVGRYVFVTGTREVMGGDMTFPLKMRDYWTPVQAAPRAPSWFEQLWAVFSAKISRKN